MKYELPKDLKRHYFLCMEAQTLTTYRGYKRRCPDTYDSVGNVINTKIYTAITLLKTNTTHGILLLILTEANILYVTRSFPKGDRLYRITQQTRHSNVKPISVNHEANSRASFSNG